MNNNNNGDRGDLTLKLIDHVLESSKITATLLEQMKQAQSSLDKLPGVISKEGSEKCNACPAREEICRLALKTLEKNNYEVYKSIKPTESKSLIDIVLPVVSNKFIWVALALFIILVLTLIGFDVLKLADL